MQSKTRRSGIREVRGQPLRLDEVLRVHDARAIGHERFLPRQCAIAARGLTGSASFGSPGFVVGEGGCMLPAQERIPGRRHEAGLEEDEERGIDEASRFAGVRDHQLVP